MPNKQQCYTIGLLYVVGSTIALILVAMSRNESSFALFAAACGACFMAGCVLMAAEEQEDEQD